MAAAGWLALTPPV